MKKNRIPETIATTTEPLSQEVIDWYMSMLEATPNEKVDVLLTSLETATSPNVPDQTIPSKKETR